MKIVPADGNAKLPAIKSASVEQLSSIFNNNKGENLNWATKFVNAPESWKASRGQGIKVALLDSGIDLDHPDLQSSIVEAKDFTGASGMTDEHGHGTHIAGIIAARQNKVGLVGIAPECNLIVGKVMEAKSSNSPSGTVDGLCRALEWASELEADIFCLALTCSTNHRGLHRLIHKLIANEKMIICAAGNNGTSNILYPGRYGAVITVGSHDKVETEYISRSGYSSYGGELDFVAPGSELWSTHPNTLFAQRSGTSMAAAVITGMATIAMSKHRMASRNETPIENIEDLRQHLRKCSSEVNYHPTTGYGSPKFNKQVSVPVENRLRKL